MNLLQTINGFDILILLIGFGIGIRAGINIQKNAQYQNMANYRHWLHGENIETQMANDGWNFPQAR